MQLPVMAHINRTGSISFFFTSSHLYGALVIPSALFQFNLMCVTFATNTYSLTSSKKIFKYFQISTLLATLVLTLTLPVNVLVTNSHRRNHFINAEAWHSSEQPSSSILWTHQFCKVNMLCVQHWPQPVCMSNDGHMQFKQDTWGQRTHVNPYIQLLAIDAPLTSTQVGLTCSVHDLC